MTTLIPAYGRDYKSKKAVMNDWNDDRDFIIADFHSAGDGQYVNRPQFDEGEQVKIRYARLAKVLVFTIGAQDVRHLNKQDA